MKCNRIKFQEEHASKFIPRAIFVEGALESLATINKRQNSFVNTILFGDKVVAIIGMVVQWKGVATVWSVLSEDIKEKPIAFHRCVQQAIKEHERALMLQRLQMNVRADFTEGCKWAEALGFKKEGLMQKFGPEGEHYFRYARIVNG